MPETVTIIIDGQATPVEVGTTVAAAVLNSGRPVLRRSVAGALRGALCGMGICFECRVEIDGMAHSRSCQIYCRAGMEVRTDG
ncbi:MAG: (2Fe-2S)-binding protein [Acidobacteriota bacterium]